jgi:hypothetical protein
MKTFFAPRSWHYSFGFDTDIDFCFWVLERDGLRVPPFYRHSDGDGSLRAAGLDAASWRAWLERVIVAGDERKEIVKSALKQKVDFAGLRKLEPAALWDGVPSVGKVLAQLAEEFDEKFDERAAVKIELVLRHNASERQLWRDLAPYRRTLPPVQIAAVGYPGPVQAAVEPKTIILAVGNWQPTPSELSAAILGGMKTLAESQKLIVDGQ